MSSKRGKRKKGNPQPPVLPKNALSRVVLGDSFAEYDTVLSKQGVFVDTNAYLAAAEPDRNKCFFIGRRGTGKTAITLQLQSINSDVIQVFPEVFVPLDTVLQDSDFDDSHQKPFKTLQTAFEATLQFEVLYRLLERGKIKRDDLPTFALQELKVEDNADFDLRAVRFITRGLEQLRSQSDTAWLKTIKRPKQLAAAINRNCKVSNKSYAILVDRIDESWDGSKKNIVFLTALMHACGELTTRVGIARAMLFLRENVYERVRETDSEFSRLETRSVGLDWTEEKLVELVERRLVAPLITKPKLGGQAWSLFFEAPDESRRLVLDYCQNRPRDVLTYLKFAIENATSKGHSTIAVDDIVAGRKRFSDSRLKDLGDEYDENFPRIQLMLDRFYGLGWRFTRRGMESLIALLLADDKIKEHCESWIYKFTTLELFVGLLFQIGFLGIVTANGDHVYRATGPQTTSTPAISSANDYLVHPMYRDALDLQDIVVNADAKDLTLGTRGLIEELPGGVDLTTYCEKLNELEAKLDSLEPGKDDAYDFEDVVGDVLRLCFFRVFANIEERVTTHEKHQIRDWIVSNRAHGGLWETVRIRWNAEQVIWECKNYAKLSASDFHQVQSYLNDEIGRFAVVVFRGDIVPAYWPHIRTIAKDKKGMALLLNDKDLKVFIRQSRSGKVKDAHVQDRLDETQRKVG